MRLSGSRVLVTGADGFIGSHLAEELVRRGAQVRAMVQYNARGMHGWLDDLEPGSRDGMEIVLSDVRDAEAMRRAVAGTEAVFHLAALIGIPYSYDAPRSYLDTNVVGTLNILEAARAADVPRTLVTSTSEVYGTAIRVPMDEDHPLSAQSPYAASKIAADQLALSYHRSFDLPVTLVRPFNTYGPRQSIRAVIPTVITQLLAGRTRVELGSLTPTRDFSFVADIARGFIALASADNAIGEVVNLGSGFEISVGDTALLISEVMGLPLELISAPQRERPRASEVRRLWAANDKARSLAGWQPEYAGRDGFRRGLAETCAWFSRPAHLAGYRAGEYGR